MVGNEQDIFKTRGLAGGIWSQTQQLRGMVGGQVQDPGITLVSDPKKFAGVSEFGFTKTNEVCACCACWEDVCLLLSCIVQTALHQ